MTSPHGDALDLDRDAPDWPNREHSRLVEAGGLRWHVQVVGREEAPVLLLLHGTGAATHSWRGLVPLLAPHFRMVALDLPGHGFTRKPARALFTLPGMADGVARLLDTLAIEPALVAAHSAGAAVMIRMVLDARIRPKGLVSINGALRPYGGQANRWLQPLAKGLFLNPLMPRLFAWRAGNEAAVRRLVGNTGSTIDPEGLAQYRLLVSNADHVAAALGMMANWDLGPLARDMGRLETPLLLIAGSNDRAIKSEDAFAVRAIVPHGRVEILRGLGHLAHEEQPRTVADPLLAFARETGALTD